APPCLSTAYGPSVISTLSLHDALPILPPQGGGGHPGSGGAVSTHGLRGGALRKLRGGVPPPVRGRTGQYAQEGPAVQHRRRGRGKRGEDRPLRDGPTGGHRL